MKTECLIALGLACLAPLGVRAEEAAAPAPLTPRIVCAEPIFDFGEKENSGVVEHNYPLRNDGTLSLEILNVHASCGCTAVKPSQNVIPPGGEATIQARFDLRGRSGFQQKTITVQSNDPQTPTLMLQLKGTALQPLRAQPATLFFGRIGPDAVRTRTFEVISGRGPIQIAGLRTDNPGFLLRQLEPQPGDDGSLHRFELTLGPDLPEGNATGTAFVKTSAADQPELAVPVAAFIVQAPAP